MCSTILQNEKHKVIGWKELFEWALGIGMTLYAIQEMGVRLQLI
jgi:hypothetical protein